MPLERVPRDPASSIGPASIPIIIVIIIIIIIIIIKPRDCRKNVYVFRLNGFFAWTDCRA